MKRAVLWIWDRGLVSTFLAGFFVVLPIALTLSIMNWVAGKFQQALGPGSFPGNLLRSIGLQFVTNDIMASLVGWIAALAGIWLLGLLVKTTTRYRFEEWFDGLLKRIPLVKSIYGPISQVVSMFQKRGQSDVSGMPVVYCTFGAHQGGGFLALLPSKDVFRFGDEDCNVIYIPTSPVPMSGCITFVPATAVRRVDMEVEELMQIYFSLGVMASSVVPSKYNLARL